MASCFHTNSRPEQPVELSLFEQDNFQFCWKFWWFLMCRWNCKILCVLDVKMFLEVVLVVQVNANCLGGIVYGRGWRRRRWGLFRPIPSLPLISFFIYFRDGCEYYFERRRVATFGTVLMWGRWRVASTILEDEESWLSAPWVATTIAPLSTPRP